MKNTAKKAMLCAAALAAALLMSGCSSGNGNANSAMSSPAVSSSAPASSVGVSNGTSSAFTEESEMPLESMLDPFESMIPDDMFDPSNGNVSE